MESFDFQDPQGDLLFKPEQFEDTFMGVGSEFPQIDSPAQHQFQEQNLQHPQPHQQNYQDLYDDHSQPGSQSDSPDFQGNGLLPQSHHSQHQNQGQKQRSDGQKRSRASGEVLALLLSEFSKNQNPNASTRKRLSEQTGMPERSVRIWFQNKRAKSRKLEKASVNDDKSDLYSYNEKSVGFSRYDQIPLTLNNNYFFIDGRSLTVGSWKRLKSGNLSSDNILNVKNLSNLSPQSINDIMTNSTDLMLIISKKNFEINYFFSAITENSKILFRIFYPISSVSDCSISFIQEDEGKDPLCELKLNLNKPPKFAVSFSHLIVQNNNQWSICDDFSEGHQVNDAFIGGSGIPHVFSGLESSLKFMNSFILDYNSTNVVPMEFELPRPDSRSPTRFPITIHRPQSQPQPTSQQEKTPQFNPIFNPDNDNSSPTDLQPPRQIQQQEIHQNPLLEQFVQDNLTEFDNFIHQPEEDFELDPNKF